MERSKVAASTSVAYAALKEFSRLSIAVLFAAEVAGKSLLFISASAALALSAQ